MSLAVPVRNPPAEIEAGGGGPHAAGQCCDSPMSLPHIMQLCVVIVMKYSTLSNEESETLIDFGKGLKVLISMPQRHT